MKKNTALDLFLETGLRHLYTAEKATLENLSTLAEKSVDSELRKCFLSHQRETEKQIQRLEKIFQRLDIDVKGSKLQGLPGITEKGKELLKTMIDLNFTDRSKGIEGILNEGKELLRHFAKTDANDIALISAGQKVEHYEIACYNSLCALADFYDENKILDLLTESLDEELAMEERLSNLVEGEFLNSEINMAPIP
ncbi:MAG TPA: DUF892 family protein [Candidatus Babeliaceae bacterium]|nr:DUF892 family protein [Candidatus Babeliaceae bacterium]